MVADRAGSRKPAGRRCTLRGMVARALRGLALALASVVLGPGGITGAQELTVSAAVSLEAAVEEVGRRFAAGRA